MSPVKFIQLTISLVHKVMVAEVLVVNFISFQMDCRDQAIKVNYSMAPEELNIPIYGSGKI